MYSSAVLLLSFLLCHTTSSFLIISVTFLLTLANLSLCPSLFLFPFLILYLFISLLA